MQWTGSSVLNFSSDELFLVKAEQISKVFEGNNIILLSLFSWRSENTEEDK